LLGSPGTYKVLDAKGQKLKEGLTSVLKKYGVQGVVNRFGSMLTMFLGVDRVSDADEARQCDRQKFARYFHGMLKRGVYLPPAPFEAMFISLAHSIADLDKTITAFDDWADRENSD